MQIKRINIDGEGPEAFIDAYIASSVNNEKRKALLVIPGGGYIAIATREREPIAEAFIPYGYTVFVLNYHTGKEKTFPIQLIQASKAIKHIKDNADEYGIDPEELFVVGFSAGGHLAGCCATLYDSPAVHECIDMPRGYTKPKGVILMYPVVNDHRGSFKNLWCTDDPSEEMMNVSAVDLLVTETSSPAFILHTANDEIVSVTNSLALAAAYTRASVPYELHIFPDAPHGVALANHITDCGKEKWNNKRIAEWVRMSAEWAEELIQKQ